MSHEQPKLSIAENLAAQRRDIETGFAAAEVTSGARENLRMATADLGPQVLEALAAKK